MRCMQPIMPAGSSSNRKDLEGKPQDDLSLSACGRPIIHTAMSNKGN